MYNTGKGKRLDNIELKLTPKQWAIRLADEMRRYPSQEDFLQAIGKGSYRQTPFLMPFYALAGQAKERWPESNREHILNEVQLNRKLRMEFQALKTLINDVNKTIEIEGQTKRQKAALQLSKLHALILQGVIAHIGVAEVLSARSASVARLHHSSLLENWADNSAILLMETTTYKSAVQTIQEKYFETHPILFKDVETEFEATIGTIRNGIAAYNQCVQLSAEVINREFDPVQQKDGLTNAAPFERESSLSIDVETIEKRAEMLADFIVRKWVTNAKTKGTADILRETGKHEDYIWQHFRKEVGLKSL
jgi:hypothetical protein